jgi:hypothetical protein
MSIHAACAQKTSSCYTNPHAHTVFLVLARCGHFCKEDVVLIAHKRESVSCGDDRVRTHAAELDNYRNMHELTKKIMCTWRSNCTTCILVCMVLHIQPHPHACVDIMQAALYKCTDKTLVLRMLTSCTGLGQCEVLRTLVCAHS